MPVAWVTSSFVLPAKMISYMKNLRKRNICKKGLTIFLWNTVETRIAWKISDAMTSIVNYSLVACVVQSWMLYLGGFISFLDFTSTTLFRSTISKNVHPTEVGRVYSVLGIFQALIPLATGTIFNTIYRYSQIGRNMNVTTIYWPFLITGKLFKTLLLRCST